MKKSWSKVTAARQSRSESSETLSGLIVQFPHRTRQVSISASSEMEVRLFCEMFLHLPAKCNNEPAGNLVLQGVVGNRFHFGWGP